MAMTVLAEKDHTSFEPATTFNAADRKLAISKNGGPCRTDSRKNYAKRTKTCREIIRIPEKCEKALTTCNT